MFGEHVICKPLVVILAIIYYVYLSFLYLIRYDRELLLTLLSYHCN